MEDEKKDTKHGLGLDLPSSKPTSSFNSFLRHQQSNDAAEQTAQQTKNTSADKSTKRKGGRHAAKTVDGLGLKHVDSSRENTESRLRSLNSITSPITQRKKSARKAKSSRNAAAPRIQVDTNIQVQQTSVPRQVYPSQSENALSHINGQQLRVAEPQRGNASASRSRLSAVMSNTPRGRISWWLKGASDPNEGPTAATVSHSPLSSLRLAGISPSDGPIPIGIDQDTLVSLRTQRNSYRSNFTERTATVTDTPAKEMMVSKWSPSSPGSTAVPASMARASSIYSSINGICQPSAAAGSVPPVPALPTSAIQNNAFYQTTNTVNYTTRNAAESDPFKSPPQPIKRTQTNESESASFKDGEKHLREEAVEIKDPPQDPRPALSANARIRPSLSIETSVPTPRRSRGWWNIITTPFLGSGAKDRKSIPALPFTNANRNVSTARATPETKDLETSTDSTFPSPTMTTVSSIDQRSESRLPVVQKDRRLPEESNRVGLAQAMPPVISNVASYQRSVSNFSQQQQNNIVKPITVNVTHVDQRTYNSYGGETHNVDTGSFPTSSPREKPVKMTANIRDFVSKEDMYMHKDLLSQNRRDRTFESPRTVPAPQAGFIERQRDKYREKHKENSKDRSRDHSRGEAREKLSDRLRDRSKEGYEEKSRDRSHDRSRGGFRRWSRNRSGSDSRDRYTERSRDRRSDSFDEKQPGRYRRNSSSDSRNYSVKVSGNPRGLFPPTSSSHQPATVPYSHGSGGAPVAGMPAPVPLPLPMPGSIGQTLRSWLPSSLSPRNLSPRRKPGRCILISVLVGLIIILLAILVPVMTLNRGGDGDNGGNSPDTLWLNVTDFPAMPSGVTTVARTNAIVQKSGCTFPTTMWSCAVPKEEQSGDASFEPDEPTFRIEIGSFNSSNSDQVESLPPPPTLEDQTFLGNTTDKNEEPFEGEEAPFFISLLPPEGEKSPERKVKRQLSGDGNDDEEKNAEDEEDEDEDGDTPDLVALIPSPSIGSDGKAAPANLLAFPKEQRLRLYNRGLDNEHYGFYIYYDRSIFLQSVSALNGSDADRIAQDEEDRDGGAPLEDASVRCTWAQTRLRVQIWTRREGKKLLPGNEGNDDDGAEGGDEAGGDKDGENAPTPESLIESGIFPYPVTLTLDRHGGSLEDKMIYCYGVDEDGEIIETQRKFQLEDRAFEGELVNPAQGPFGNVTVDVDDGGPGGIDGGSGGCSCEYVNWVEE